MAKSGLFLVKDNLPKLLAAIEAITNSEILVGVPASDADRLYESDKRRPGSVTRKSKTMSNAALAYWHDNGAPEANIPARPFMHPGINDAKPKVVKHLAKVAISLLDGSKTNAAAAMNAAGISAVSAIRRRINEGPPPPLAESTIRARARAGSRGAREHLAFMDWPASMRKAARDAGMGIAKPLVVTGQLRNSITYIVRQNSGAMNGAKMIRVRK